MSFINVIPVLIWRLLIGVTLLYPYKTMLKTSTCWQINTGWCEDRGKNPTKWTRAGKKGRKMNSYLSDVAVKETISTLAGKRHHTHYSDRGKHALSPEPFQILLRPTQQSCTSRFLTEGNPDVIHITPWNSAAAVPLPSLLLSTQQMKKCLKSCGFCCTMRICLTVNCSTHTQEDAEKGAPKTSLWQVLDEGWGFE